MAGSGKKVLVNQEVTYFNYLICQLLSNFTQRLLFPNFPQTSILITLHKFAHHVSPNPTTLQPDQTHKRLPLAPQEGEEALRARLLQEQGPRVEIRHRD